MGYGGVEFAQLVEALIVQFARAGLVPLRHAGKKGLTDEAVPPPGKPVAGQKGTKESQPPWPRLVVSPIADTAGANDDKLYHRLRALGVAGLALAPLVTMALAVWLVGPIGRGVGHDVAHQGLTAHSVRARQ